MPTETTHSADRAWTFAGTRSRQLEAGARMTPAERLIWLEEVLDELLPLVGRANVEQGPAARCPQPAE